MGLTPSDEARIRAGRLATRVKKIGQQPWPPWTLGASMGRWTTSNILPRLRQLADLVQVVSLMLRPDNVAVFRSHLRAIKDTADDLGLRLCVHGPVWDIHTASVHPSVRRAGVSVVQKHIEFAAAIGASHLTLHPGPSSWHHVCPDMANRALRAQERSFLELASMAKQAGVSVGIENMPPAPDCLPGYDDLTALGHLLDRLPDTGLTLDIGHLQLAGVDLQEVVKQYGQRIQHVHVHDNLGLADDHLPPGQGMIDWPDVCSALLSLDYQGVVEVECYSGHDDLVYAVKHFGQAAQIAMDARQSVQVSHPEE